MKSATSTMALFAAPGAAAYFHAHNHWQLRGRVVLITGGSRGLGLATAREFARQGAVVAICAREEGELQRAAADVARLGKVAFFRCDLKQSEEIRHMIDQVRATLGEIDVLVNNAGVITVGPVETMTIDDFREAMDVNFWGALETILAVLPTMLARRAGKIVNIASVGGKIPVPHLIPYCASKFALVGLSGGLHAELKRHNIQVTTINPGLVRTGSPRNANFKGQHQAEYAWFNLGDSLPGLSMSAERAARKIVGATVRGCSEVTLSLPAQIGAALYGLSPKAHLELTAIAANLLPRANGQRQRFRGDQSGSAITRSPLTALGRRAEKQLNQLRPEGRDS